MNDCLPKAVTEDYLYEKVEYGVSLVYDRYVHDVRIRQNPEPEQKLNSALFPIYWTKSQVLNQLQDHKEPEKRNVIFSKMAPALCKDQEFMLTLIECESSAYMYAHKSITDEAFALKSIELNPSVFDVLTEEQQKDMRFITAYIESMEQHMGSNHDSPAKFKYQFSEKIDKQLLFSEERYRANYKSLIQSAPYHHGSFDDLYNPSLSFLLAAKTLNPQMTDKYDQIEREVLVESIKEHDIYRSSLFTGVQQDIANQLIEAVKHHCPEMLEQLEQEFVNLEKESHIRWQRVYEQNQGPQNSQNTQTPTGLDEQEGNSEIEIEYN